jgi:hypothetical protein
MACAFDTTGSAVFWLLKVFLLLLSTWSGFLLPVVKKKVVIIVALIN